MKSHQKGFTLVEIAIVLVIIGLLLGGVLKGQELINSAKVKNIASDFRNVQVMIYGYQDKFRKLPGDDNTATARWSLESGHDGDGDGIIEGDWNSETLTDESVLIWEHLRRGNLASGSTDFSSANFKSALPTNSEGGRFGLSGAKPISTMNGGTFYACSTSIDGKFAQQLDLMLDDGAIVTGSVQGTPLGTTTQTQQASGTSNSSGQKYVEGTRYTICMTY